MTDKRLLDGWKLETPVVFIVFNRPDVTEQAFRAIAQAKPPKLLVVADAAREGRAGEREACERARAIATAVDWPCEIATNFAAANMGCRRRVLSGLDWAFSKVDQAIILEDDCVPEPGFFRFCQELLERYRDDPSISQVGGVNFQDGIRRGDASYYFSRHNHIWGWATWRRAWTLHRDAAQRWGELRHGPWLRNFLGTWRETRFWAPAFDGTFSGKIDAWSYEWIFTSWLHGMLSVVPETNLVSNIGFGPEATHTKTVGPHAAMSTSDIDFPLVHPHLIVRDARADDYTDRKIFSRSTSRQLSRLVKQRLRNALNSGRAR